MSESVCQHVDCTRDETAALSEYTLIGTEWSAAYCNRHAPVDDMDAADLFECVEDNDAV